MANARTPLTLMTVHAHPDDEAISTGGVLARAAAEGIRTVVVTCTNGELGDAPGGVKPGEKGHDEAEVVAIRRVELEKACRELGVEHLEMLGYHDSGMVDWSYKDRSDAFAQVPVADVGAVAAGVVAGGRAEHRGHHREPERAADLLAHVEQRRGQTGVGVRDLRHRDRRQRQPGPGSRFGSAGLLRFFHGHCDV